MPASDHPPSFVSRAGLKLDHALTAFGLDVTGLICADFGCNVGGFTDCLLQRGAAHVYALDTAYGLLDYRLRTDDRVTVLERTNALHAAPPWGAASTPPSPPGTGAGGEGGQTQAPPKPPLSPPGVDLVTNDHGWTPQRLAVPAALRWLKPPPATPNIITLVKPQYELTPDEKRTLLIDGRLDPANAERIFHRALDDITALGLTINATTCSPITGGKSSRKSHGRGNVEFLVLASPGKQPVA